MAGMRGVGCVLCDSVSEIQLLQVIFVRSLQMRNATQASAFESSLVR